MGSTAPVGEAGGSWCVSGVYGSGKARGTPADRVSVKRCSAAVRAPQLGGGARVGVWEPGRAWACAGWRGREADVADRRQNRRSSGLTVIPSEARDLLQ